ncbi:MAG TPA: tetratricopeptide repeat protein [Candidatus Angelobacter sp.]|nr:tetratricopeptide repeat protein [Candidatus Angelobacter sp.]
MTDMARSAANPNSATTCFKLQITAWTRFDPSNATLSDLARAVEEGAASVSAMEVAAVDRIEEVDDPEIRHQLETLPNRAKTWSGTVAELAAATGIPAEEISDAVENRSQRLRKAGIAATVEQAPGKPPIVTLYEVESGVAPEQPSGDQELEEAHAASGDQDSGDKVEVEPERSQEESVEANPDVTEAPGEPPAIRHSTWKLRAAVALGMLAAGLAAIVYLAFPSSAHRAEPVSQPLTRPVPTQPPDELAALRNRADAGDIGSQTELADRYREGNGVPQDNKTAMALYRDAAIKGDPVAQYRLGLALSSGDGVAADRVAAYAWLVMARTGGQTVDPATMDSLTHSLTPSELVEVRYRLGLMYERGVGCVADPVTADEWFLLGEEVGDSRSRTESADLERRMSKEQIRQAHVRAADWLRRHSLKTGNQASLR